MAPLVVNDYVMSHIMGVDLEDNAFSLVAGSI